MNNTVQFVCSHAIAILMASVAYAGLSVVAPPATAVSAGGVVWMLFAQIAFVEDLIRGIDNE